MRVDEARHGVDHPGLHVDERLASGEAKATRVTLHLLPFGQLHQRLELLPRPLAEVTLEQPARRTNTEPQLLGDRARRLLGSLERRRVDGCDFEFERRETLRDGARLLEALVGEMKAVRTPRQRGPGRRRLAVTNEEQERAECGL